MRKQFPLILTTAGMALFLAAFVWVYLAAAQAASTPYAWAEGPAKVAGSMADQVKLWDQGPHASVACLQCHQEVDPQQLRDAYATGGAIDLTAWMKIDQNRCEECHDSQKDAIYKDIRPAPLKGAGTAAVGQPMQVRALHELHVKERETSCTDCHAVHQPSEPPPHQRCLDCHHQEQVKIEVKGDLSCAACHLDLSKVMPDDHKDAARWTRTHGQASKAQNCADCHLSNSAGPHKPGLADPAFFPTTQQGDRGEVDVPEHATPQFCTDCHLEPMPHSSSFLAAHGARATQSPQTCEACHSSKNPANPTARHASQTYCATCHDSYQHEQGWVASHGKQAEESCATCHTVEHGQGGRNACAACHISKGQWHEKMWFVKHGRVVNAEGDASCLRCHGQVEPSCSKCHAGR